ncbi:LOW QUALITY PROTEIN: hypothetical protein HID58_086717 [Brassica napus]|uniref:Uncharacterized protein n=1 Tax=Brassica napus TaxID=3708 RepID=A0ABQ7XRJ3_BRANA|nr:LOW QUALITY PROTEIN: hypothetical protein HID58_086717 [Brassica napus]
MGERLYGGGWRRTFTRRNTAETYGEDDVAEEEASIKGERQRAPILELSKIVDVFLGFWVLEFLVGAGDEEGEAQTKLRRDGEDSGARGNKDGVVGKPNERKAAKQEDEAVNKRLPTQTDTGEDKCLKEVKRWRGRWVHYWAALWGSLRMADCATDDGVWGGEGRGLGREVGVNWMSSGGGVRVDALVSIRIIVMMYAGVGCSRTASVSSRKKDPKSHGHSDGVEPSSDIFHSPAITIHWSAMKDRWKEKLELTA